jgi:hypothetical protein
MSAAVRPALPSARTPSVPESSLPNVGVGFSTLQSFEFTQRAAKAFANSTLVPEAFRSVIPNKRNKDEYIDNPNALPNCIIALNMATRMGADPLMVMQNLYVVEGRPSWSSQFIISAINSCGRFSPLRFDLSEPGEEQEVEFETYRWENRQKVTYTAKTKIRPRTCRAWAIEKATGERLDGPEVSMQMALEEGWLQKNGSKWRTMPEVMLRYRCAAFFGKLYAPELLMGMTTVEEAHDIIDASPGADGNFEVKGASAIVDEGSSAGPTIDGQAETVDDDGVIHTNSTAGAGDAPETGSATKPDESASEKTEASKDEAPSGKAEASEPDGRPAPPDLFGEE